MKKGFTLIELLVVIAIIGTLSTVVFASLNSARTKGRIAAAQSTMRALQPALVSCLNDGVDINIPTETQTSEGGALCTGGVNYSSLPSRWVYCDGTAETVGGTCATTELSSQVKGTSFVIKAFGDAKYITCQESGCTTK